MLDSYFPPHFHPSTLLSVHFLLRKWNQGLLLRYGDHGAWGITLLSSTCLSWKMWTPAHHHKAPGMKIQETPSCPNRGVSHLLAVCRADWRSDYLAFDWTAGKYLDLRKSQIVLLELWPHPLQRKLQELKAERERETPKSLAVTFPWETKLWRPHRLALSEGTVLTPGQVCYTPANLPSMEVIDRTPLCFQSPAGLWVLCECVGYRDTWIGIQGKTGV